jgi:hypothetical protein
MDLTQEEQYVFHIIEKSKNVGLWTREIKKHSRISGQSEITSILQRLLQKKLVKQVKDIQNKTQKKYMLYDFEPSDKMTGGPWYTDQGDFDQDFYHATEAVILETVDHLNRPLSTKPPTAVYVHKVLQRNQAENQKLIKIENVQQVIQTLVFDEKLEPVGMGGLTAEEGSDVKYRVTGLEPDGECFAALLMPSWIQTTFNGPSESTLNKRPYDAF